jgi:hypothetical protein
MSRGFHSRLTAILAAQALARRTARRAAFRRRSVREPLAMLGLWTLTASLGLTLVIVAISGLTGYPQGGWHVPDTIWREVRPRQFSKFYDAKVGREVSQPVKEVAMKLHAPSPSAYGLAVIGLVACLAGFSRRRISALAVLSAVLLLAAILVPFLFILAAQSYFRVLDALK